MEEDKNMKKILSLLAFIMGVFAFSSCVSDVDDVFSDSAANRAQKALTETKTLLESAPNGWRVEYYGDVTYGGCHFTIYGGLMPVIARKCREQPFSNGAPLLVYSIETPIELVTCAAMNAAPPRCTGQRRR